MLLDAKKELKSYIKNPNEKIDAEAFGLSRPGVCENRVKCEGLTKSGQLKRGYKFAGGGGGCACFWKKGLGEANTVSQSPKTILINLAPTPLKLEQATPVAVPVQVEQTQTVDVNNEQATPVVSTPVASAAKKIESSVSPGTTPKGFVLASESPKVETENIFYLKGENRPVASETPAIQTHVFNSW